jgi:hypothetical protein
MGPQTIAPFGAETQASCALKTSVQQIQPANKLAAAKA